MSEKEYLMLRDELLHLDDVIVHTINFSYAFLASLIAFALTQEDTLYIMLSYLVILPAYLIVLSKLHGMSKIGGYLYVYHEKYGNANFQWETMNLKFANHVASKDIFSINWITSFMYTFHFPYAMLNIAIFGLFLFRTHWNCLAIYDICKISICSFIFIFLFLLINKNKIGRASCRERVF